MFINMRYFIYTLVYIGFALINPMHAQDPDISSNANDNQNSVESNTNSNEIIDDNDNVDAPIIDNDVGSNVESSKEIDEKGGEHMIEIVVTLMLTMNILFMIYCCIAEKKKAKKISKYHVVSSDEFAFDTVDVNNIDNLQNNKNDNIEDIDIGGNVNNDIQIDDDK